MSDTKASALHNLAKALRYYIACVPQSLEDDNEDSIWGAVVPGHRVHNAVVRLQRFYPGETLPDDVRPHWRELCRASRAEEQDATELAATEMLQWAEARHPEAVAELASTTNTTDSFWGRMPAINDMEGLSVAPIDLMRLHDYWSNLPLFVSNAFELHGRAEVGTVKAHAMRAAHLLIVAAEQRGLDSSVIMPGHKALIEHLDAAVSRADWANTELPSPLLPPVDEAYTKAADLLNRLRIRLADELHGSTETGRTAAGDGQQSSSDAVKTFTVGEALELLGISDTTLNRYAKMAGIETPGRGKRNFRYTAANMTKVIQFILDKSNDHAMKNKARAALAKL